MKKLEQLWQTFLSVVKILLQSKWRTHLPSSFSNPEELLILANGPSLNRTVRKLGLCTGQDAAGGEFLRYFPDVRAASPGDISDSRPSVLDCSREAGTIVPDACRKTAWPMSLFIPARALKNKEWQPMLAGNRNIRLCIYNTTPIEGVQDSATGYSLRVGVCPVRTTY